ncbi:MAG: YfiR family protein [Bacteroidota bacterium]
MFLVALSLPAAADETVAEYQLKAAFLYNFAKFVEWPAAAFDDSTSPFSLCILGTEPYLAAKEILSGKSVRGRAIEVRHIETLKKADNCHMLFVASADQGTGPHAFALANSKTLTVGEEGDFIVRGGIINLKRVDDKLRFEIARLVGQRLGFRFSAQLLKLATVVDSVK